MSQPVDNLAITLFSEILAVDQLARNTMSKVLPKGMELSHFSVLNHLAFSGTERSPAQLAKTFHLTRGAMTNTLGKLEWAGWVHIRPDWDDARRKMVAISLPGLRRAMPPWPRSRRSLRGGRAGRGRARPRGASGAARAQASALGRGLERHPLGHDQSVIRSGRRLEVT
ncbi:transcriptional regulator, MarR family [Limimaricola cinnabarinus LL-001]|uniref:Transcriptional regulator, MarR family n=1 Tax=Limimaricola cinnabarinus LL-001 TaxID=1337093 RepID=U3AIU7_9RHOB|nr:transcriptional regulator, MarR family [Limimaricola cinnabarinus LL-001]